MNTTSVPTKTASTDINPAYRADCEECRRSLFSSYPEVMSIEQVSEAVGVCSNSVRKLIREHDLPAKKVNYKWRVLRQDLQDWMLVR